jgi:hypothetical protein
MLAHSRADSEFNLGLSAIVPLMRFADKPDI